MTHGFNPIPDYTYPPASIVVWGVNLAAIRIGEFGYLSGAMKKGSKLVVIDPRKTELSNKANLWVQLRPGSDLDSGQGE